MKAYNILSDGPRRVFSSPVLDSQSLQNTYKLSTCRQYTEYANVKNCAIGKIIQTKWYYKTIIKSYLIQTCMKLVIRRNKLNR